MMELEEVMALDPQEALMHVGEAIKDLLIVKRTLKLIEDYKDEDTNKQYQKALQKLEGEVRNHIKIEHQLRLYIEHTQAKLDESEKKLKVTDEEFQQKLKSLQGERKKWSEVLQAKDKELYRIKNNSKLNSRTVSETEISVDKNFNVTQEISSLKQHANRDAQRIIELEKRSQKLEQEWARLKEAFENKELEIQKIKKESEKIKSNLSKNKDYVYDSSIPTAEFYRRKYEEKCIEVLDIEKRIRGVQAEDKKQPESINYRSISTQRSFSPMLLPHKSQKTLDLLGRESTASLSNQKSLGMLEKSKSTERLRREKRSSSSLQRNRINLSNTLRK